MPAPVPAARQTPLGRRLGDGFKTTITFSAYPTVALWEVVITPPGIDNMAPSDSTNMHNAVWRTSTPRKLKTLTPGSGTAMWDPKVYSDMSSLCGVNTTITYTFPDLSTIAFFGIVQSFKPGPLEDGKRPECTFEVVPTNTDPTDCSEQAFTYTPGPGTGPC